jgi:hypothetical protein
VSVSRFWRAEFLFRVEYYVLFLRRHQLRNTSLSPARTDLALKLLNYEQFEIFVDMLDTSIQKLVFLHAGGGTGKTFVTCKIFEELAR